MSKKYILHSAFPHGVNFKINYIGELTAEQLPIVTAGAGPILVIAGAGSGKTRTVTYRVAYLIEKGIPQERILLCTFTNKAAKEMLRRVETLLKAQVSKMWGGTFHHIANLFLRKHARLLGYNNNFAILDESDSKELISTCIAQANIEVSRKRFPKADLLRNIFSYAINTSTSIDVIVNERYPHFTEEIEKIKTVSILYAQRKKQHNLMDFDDLLINWRKLLEENPEVCRRYADQFQYILVDEYQDTNIIQAEIMDLLAGAHRNIMVVGDDSQSIYSFRGAHYKNILNFPEKYKDAQIFKLEVNHRSSPQILAVANASIENAKFKFEKKLSAVKSDGILPVLIPCRDVYEQAEVVSQRILELREEGTELSDMAVLYRSHYHSMELQISLTKRGIPFIVRSGLRFFEEAHIKDVLSYLKIFHNPTDEIAWKRILKLMPKIGPATAEKIWQIIAASSEPFNAVKTDKAAAAVARGGERYYKEFIRYLDVLSELKDKPAEMIQAIVDLSYSEYVRNTYPNFDERLEDLKQLSNYALQYSSLEKFLSDLALVGGIASEDVVEGEKTEDEWLVMSSIHQAKGLEWSKVFIIWLADGRFPVARAFGDEEAEEEERRLFYVAVTRSKDELYMTYPLVSNEFGASGRIIFRPSRFIQEIPESLYEEWEIEPEDEKEEGLDLEQSEWGEEDEDDRGDMIIDIGLN